jgi:hypothetical protein
MVVLVVLLLCWECGGLKVWLPPRLANQTDKNWERQQFVEGWLEQRMAKETAERLEQVQQATAEQEPPSAKDAERQAFVKQRLELRMEREKGSRRLGRLARELEAAGIHDKLAQAAGVNDRADADDSSGRRECGEHHAIAAWEAQVGAAPTTTCRARRATSSSPSLRAGVCDLTGFAHLRWAFAIGMSAVRRADMFCAASTLKRSRMRPWCPSDLASTGNSIMPPSSFGSPTSRISINFASAMDSLAPI